MNKEAYARLIVESPQHGPAVLAELESLRAQLEKRRLNVAMPDGRTALAVNEIVQEMMEALQNHGPLASPHEGLGVLLEEFEELKDWVKMKECRRDPIAGRAEAKQVAAVALRFMLDCCDPKTKNTFQCDRCTGKFETLVGLAEHSCVVGAK